MEKNHYGIVDTAGRACMYIIIITTLFIVTTGSEAQAMPVVNFFGPTDHRIGSVTGVDVSGVTYDATFIHGGSYLDHQSSLSPFMFTSFDSAKNAMLELASVIDGETRGFTGGDPVTTNVITPYHLTGGGIVGNVTMHQVGSSILDYAVSLMSQGTHETSSLPNDEAWVLWTTASVPEPNLGLLLGISLVGLVGTGAVRKIKQSKIANT